MYNQLLIKRRDLTGEISQQKKKKKKKVFSINLEIQIQI